MPLQPPPSQLDGRISQQSRTQQLTIDGTNITLETTIKSGEYVRTYAVQTMSRYSYLYARVSAKTSDEIQPSQCAVHVYVALVCSYEW